MRNLDITMLLDETTPELEQDENETESVEEETEEETTETKEEEKEVDWKAEALKYKAILARNKEKKPTEAEEKKTDGFGYDVKAYLKASGIQASEFDFVKAELKKAGGDIDGLIDNEYFQAKLEKNRALNKTKDASIKGKRTGNVATDSVDYWLTKPFEDVPLEMRGKVLEAEENKSKTTGKFYNS